MAVTVRPLAVESDAAVLLDVMALVLGHVTELLAEVLAGRGLSGSETGAATWRDTGSSERLYDLLAGGDLAGQQEGSNQLALAADNHTGEPLEPLA